MLVVLVSVVVGYILRGLVDWTLLRSRHGGRIVDEHLRIAAEAEAERRAERGEPACVILPPPTREVGTGLIQRLPSDAGESPEDSDFPGPKNSA